MNVYRFGWNLMLFVLLVARMFLIPVTMAQTSEPQVFYAVTFNETTRDTSIWEVDTTRVTIRQILTLDRVNHATPNELFPEYERRLLREVIRRDDLLEGRADGSIIQHIIGVWLLNTNHMLVLTRNETHIGQGFYLGYYEFLIADIMTSDLTSLMRIAYHDPITEETGCSLHWQAYVDSVLPHPTQDIFAFTLKTYSRSCASDWAQTYLVDYSSLPIDATLLPASTGAAWSPDGMYLSYYTRESCSHNVCDTSVYMLPASSLKEPVILNRGQLYLTTPLFSVWRDNRTVLYRWRSTTHGDVPPSSLWHDIVDDAISESPVDFVHVTAIYHLEQEQSNLVAVGHDSVFGLTQDATPVTLATFSSIRRVFYNSRFPEYMFVSYDHTSFNLTEMLIIDAELNQATLNLADFFPEDSDEMVVFVANGPVAHTTRPH